jgi:homoserine dehydrogenase
MVNIAVLGFGVVGSGVVELIKANHDKIAGSAAQEINVKYILDIRQFPDSPYKDLFINRFEIIENDPEIQIVVETIGGQGVAYEYTIRSLQAGKSVVTSNKELVRRMASDTEAGKGEEFKLFVRSERWGRNSYPEAHKPMPCSK